MNTETINNLLPITSPHPINFPNKSPNLAVGDVRLLQPIQILVSSLSC